jgi:spore coat protein A, manganese oxidase
VSLSRWRGVALGFVLVLAAAGYAAMPSQPASAAPRGVVYGHVPTADAITSATIVIPRNAQVVGYKTKVVTISQGGTLNVVNLDSIEHTVTSVATGAHGPLFYHLAKPGSAGSIPIASKLAPGTYKFFCSFHPATMRGTLIVEKGPGGGGIHPTKLKYEQPLELPRVITAAHITIPVRRAKVRVLPHGPKTWMWTYGGSYPGPTIVRPAGKDTKVTFVNRLPKKAGAITVHLHGDHHPWQDDGQPDRFLIRHGGRRTYNYPLTDGGKPETEAFDWYHDHRMNETARNNWYGMQGMFIVTNKVEREFRLPTGSHDLPLMVSDRSFNKKNQLTDPFRGRTMSMTGMKGPDAPPGDAVVGKQILVDGRYAPYRYVTATRYRLQLLNSSEFETYDFELSDGRPFVQIGTGDDLLPKPVIRNDIQLGPSQRADVIVDFHGEQHQNVELETITNPQDAPVGVGSPTASLMQFRVTHAATDHSRIPPKLVKPPYIHAPKRVSYTWTFGLGGNAKTGTYWTVNGKPFNPRRVDVEVPLGATRTWELKNVSPVTHFIHLHEEQWHTISIDGKKPPPWDRGLEDTWRLDPGETIKVAARFTDYTGVFMVHCHMLVHEDDGMMAQFAVVNPHTHKLPRGYYLSGHGPKKQTATAGGSTQASMSSMPMPMADGSGGTAGPSSSAAGWQRVMIRSSRVLALELFVITLLFAWRRYRRDGLSAV